MFTWSTHIITRKLCHKGKSLVELNIKKKQNYTYISYTDSSILFFFCFTSLFSVHLSFSFYFAVTKWNCLRIIQKENRITLII